MVVRRRYGRVRHVARHVPVVGRLRDDAGAAARGEMRRTRDGRAGEETKWRPERGERGAGSRRQRVEASEESLGEKCGSVTHRK